MSKRKILDIRADILNSYVSGTKWVDDINKLLTEYKEAVEEEYVRKQREKNINKILE